MQVKDLMRTDVTTCSPEQSAHQAAELMWREDLGCLPVVDDVHDEEEDPAEQRRDHQQRDAREAVTRPPPDG